MPRGRPRKKPTEILIKSAEMIGWALGGLEREILDTRQRLTALTAQANQLRLRIAAKAGTTASSAAPAAETDGSEAPVGRKRRRRKMSAEARRKISERMKKTWAERRKKT